MHIHSTPTVKSSYFDDFIFFKQKEFTGFGHPAIIKYLKEDPAKILPRQLQKAAILKEKPNLIYKISLPDNTSFQFSTVAVKRCRARNILMFLLSPFRQSKAKRSFLAARYLITHNLDTPLPLAFIEKRKAGFIVESYYITEALEDSIKVKKYLQQYPERESDIRELLHVVADYIQRMHTSGMVHRDCNLANFLLSSVGDEKRLVLVDLNRYRVRKNVSPFARVWDIGRLYWGVYRSEFFKIYSGENTDIIKWEWFFNYYYLWRKKRRRFKNWLKGRKLI